MKKAKLTAEETAEAIAEAEALKLRRATAAELNKEFEQLVAKARKAGCVVRGGRIYCGDGIFY